MSHQFTVVLDTDVNPSTHTHIHTDAESFGKSQCFVVTGLICPWLKNVSVYLSFNVNNIH